MKTYMAVDRRYGVYEHDLGPHPRKELLKRYRVQHAEKLYVDRNYADRHLEGVHRGYVIAGHWFELYEVTEFTGVK